MIESPPKKGGYSNHVPTLCIYAHATVFAEHLNNQIQYHGGDLSQTVRQTDNGIEYIGSWQARSDSSYTQAVESVKGQTHQTIPPRAHRWQSDVETVHDIMEREYYELETFKNRENFLQKYTAYQWFFNLIRPNTYKENKTPWELALEKNPDIPIGLAMIPPVDLDALLEKRLIFWHAGVRMSLPVPNAR